MFEVEDDPSVWPKEFPEMKKIDSLLRCSICFEYFNTAVVVPTCSHNYCSFCIRKHVAQKKCCPACNKPLSDVDLKCNRVLDELVLNFKTVRAQLLQVIIAYQSQDSVKRATGNEVKIQRERDSQESVFETSQRFRNPMVNKECMKSKTKHKDEQRDSTITEIDTENDNIHEQIEIDPGFATCPVCQEQLPVKRINIHLDSCLRQENRQKRNRKTSPLGNGSKVKKRKKNDLQTQEESSSNSFTTVLQHEASFSQSSTQKETANDLIVASTSRVMKPLPKVCYDALSDKQLRTKLKSYSLPTKGDKRTLIKRLGKYVLLHNSQCDSSRPLSPRSIAKRIEKDEVELSKHGYKPSIVIPTHDLSITEEEKMERLRKHGKQHEDHFTELIEQVKSRKQTAIKSDVVQSENEREEYLFDIVEVNSDESSNGADTNAYGEPKASKTFDIASDNKCRAKLTHNVRTSSSTIRSTSKPPRVKSNASSRKKQNLKENSVKSRDIITFFKPGNKAILKEEKITPVKLKNNAKLQCNNSPSLVARVDGASSLTTAYKSANQKTGELSNIPESPPFASSEKKHMFKNYAKFNSTAVERHNLKPELLPNLSPVFEDEDIKREKIAD